MRRACLWVLAVLLGSLASAETARFEPVGMSGWPALGFFVLSLLVLSFVAVSVVTAMETMFPSLRTHPAPSQTRRG
jgi:hypothetical protein